MRSIKNRLIECLSAIDLKTSGHILLGFDAFIDIITKPVMTGHASSVEQYYESMEQLGQHLIDKSGYNCSIELCVCRRKLGGNTPNMAHALGQLGLHSTCIAPFGEPQIDPVFTPLLTSSHLISTGTPGTSYALEFQNGKVMLALNHDVNRQDWIYLQQKVTLQSLKHLFQSCDMMCFLNWSELPGSTDILRGIVKDLFPLLSCQKPFLIDLSDCSRRQHIDLVEVLNTIASFPPDIHTILSMNQNESLMVCHALGIDNSLPDQTKAKRLQSQLNVHWVAFHNRQRCLLCTQNDHYVFHTRMTGPPVLLTGAGDHFNAGLCLGYLASFEPDLCLVLAAMTAGFYVERGISANPADLVEYVSKMEDLSYETDETGDHWCRKHQFLPGYSC